MHRDNSETTHIRVKKSSVQRLRLAIIQHGGVFHGMLTREASIALEKHADYLLRKTTQPKRDDRTPTPHPYIIPRARQENTSDSHHVTKEGAPPV